MKKKIKAFIESNLINTGGAIAKPKVTIKYYDDGDTGFYIKVPYCPWNSSWQMSAFSFVEKFQKEFKFCPVYLHKSYFKIDFNLTACDPD